MVGCGGFGDFEGCGIGGGGVEGEGRGDLGRWWCGGEGLGVVHAGIEVAPHGPKVGIGAGAICPLGGEAAVEIELGGDIDGVIEGLDAEVGTVFMGCVDRSLGAEDEGDGFDEPSGEGGVCGDGGLKACPGGEDGAGAVIGGAGAVGGGGLVKAGGVALDLANDDVETG